MSNWLRYWKRSRRETQMQIEWVSEHFTLHELSCTHCGVMPYGSGALDRLESLRMRYGFPMIVSSGHRCPEHPIEKNKPHGPGPHSVIENDNVTLDVKCYGKRSFWLVECALNEGYTGIGINQKLGSAPSDRFIHIDRAPELLPHRPRPLIWSY